MPSVEERLDDIASALRAVAAALEALRVYVVHSSAAAAAAPAASASANAAPTVNVCVGAQAASPPPQPVGEPEPAAEPALASTPCGAGAPASDGPARRPADRAAQRGRASPRVGSRGEYVYTIWSHPERPVLVGVHAGGIDAWYAIERTLPGPRYVYRRDGVRLRRFETLEAGLAGYRAESGRHHAPPEPRVWHHPLQDDL